MANSMLNERDPDDFNARILAKIAKSCLTRYEGCHLPFEVKLCSPEVKRLFAGKFNSFQGNLSAMLATARLLVPPEVPEAVDQAIRRRLVECSDRVTREIALAWKRIDGSGVARMVGYADEPVVLTAKVISSYGRRYLELLLNADQLMVMLDTLAAAGLMDGKQCDERKKHIQRRVRRIAGTVLAWWTELNAARSVQDYANWPSGLRRTAAVACRMPAKEDIDGCADLFSAEAAAGDCMCTGPDAG